MSFTFYDHLQHVLHFSQTRTSKQLLPYLLFKWALVKNPFLPCVLTEPMGKWPPFYKHSIGQAVHKQTSLISTTAFNSKIANTYRHSGCPVKIMFLHYQIVSKQRYKMLFLSFRVSRTSKSKQHPRNAKKRVHLCYISNVWADFNGPVDHMKNKQNIILLPSSIYSWGFGILI